MGRGLWLGNYKEQLIGINVWLCYHKRCMNYKLIENVSYYRQSLHIIKSSQKQITIYFLIDICNKTCWLINLTKQVFEKGHGPVEEGADIVRPFSPINFFFSPSEQIKHHRLVFIVLHGCPHSPTPPSFFLFHQLRFMHAIFLGHCGD